MAHWAYATLLRGAPPPLPVVKHRDYTFWVTIHQHYTNIDAQDDAQEDLMDIVPALPPSALQHVKHN